MVKVILISVILTTILTWPLLLNINSFYADSSDYPLVGWMLWYSSDALLSGKIFNPQNYFNSNQFYPFAYSLAFSEQLLVPSMIYLPLKLVTGDHVAAVNLYTYLTFILSFLSCFYTLRFFVKSKAALIFGSLIYTFNPLVFSHTYGHLHLQGRYFLPPLFLSTFLFFKNPNLKKGLLLSLLFVLNSLTSVYFFIFSVALLPLFSFFSLEKRKLKEYLKYLTLPVGLTLPVLAYFYLPYWNFSKAEGITRNINEIFYYASRPMDFLFSLPNNLIYGNLAKQFEPLRIVGEVGDKLNYAEHTLFLNLVPTVLALIGIYFAFKSRSKFFIPYLVLMIASTAFSTGLYKYLYLLNPFFAGIRVPSRMQFIFYVPFSLFASYGVEYLVLNRKKFTRIILIVLFIFLLSENIFTADLSKARSENITYLKSHDLSFLKHKNTIHFPSHHTGAEPSYQAGYLNWSTQTNETTFNGYSGYFPPEWIKLADQFNNLDDQSLLIMRAIGIDYLIIHKEAFELNRTFSQIVYQDEKVLIVDLKKEVNEPKLCNKNQDITIDYQFTTNSIQYSNKSDYHSIGKVRLVNKADCFLVNKFYDRYSSINLYLNGQTKHFKVKLPAIVKPKETVDLRWI